MYGCTVAQAPLEQATPSPAVTPQQVSSAPELENPLAEFWNRFEQAGEPCFFQLDAQADSGQNIEMLDKTLALSQHMQRLQQMFFALTGLGQSGETAAGWSGMLVGGSEGTGDIEATQQGYTFTCDFSDSSTLSGTLQHDVLRGEWSKQDRQSRIGEILLAKTGWYSLCNWEDGNSLLFISDDTLWFAQGVDGLPSASQSPADWADWSYRDGAFTVFAQ